MNVSLTNTDTISCYLPVSDLTWACSASRTYGSATITVPIDSPAYSEDYINVEGGSFVEITDSVLGDWSGVVSDVSGDTEGVTLSVSHLARVFTVLPLLVSRTFNITSAGLLVQQAATDALGGLAHDAIRIGTIVMGGTPVVSQTGSSQYSYGTSNTLDSVLTDAMSQSGQEWELRKGALNWVPRVGGYYEKVLVEEHDIVDLTWDSNGADRVSRVTVISSKAQSQDVIAPEVAGNTWWPSHTIVSSSSSSDIANALLARQSLEQGRYPIVTLNMKLSSEHWANVREGDLITVLSTRVGISGRLLTCRVLTRTYSETDDWLPLTVEVVTPLSPATIWMATAEQQIPRTGQASTTINSPMRSLVIPEARKTGQRTWANFRDF